MRMCFARQNMNALSKTPSTVLERLSRALRVAVAPVTGTPLARLSPVHTAERGPSAALLSGSTTIPYAYPRAAQVLLGVLVASWGKIKEKCAADKKLSAMKAMKVPPPPPTPA